jgi:hypothetical protein
VLLIAASILMARHINYVQLRPSPALGSAIADAVQLTARIMATD